MDLESIEVYDSVKRKMVRLVRVKPQGPGVPLPPEAQKQVVQDRVTLQLKKIDESKPIR